MQLKKEIYHRDMKFKKKASSTLKEVLSTLELSKLNVFNEFQRNENEKAKKIENKRKEKIAQWIKKNAQTEAYSQLEFLQLQNQKNPIINQKDLKSK